MEEIKIMTTKEVAGICGVTDKTIYNNADKANVILEHGKSHDWTEDEVKRLQLVLMRNATNAGGQQTDKSMIKSTLERTFQSGLTIQELIRSGNVDAMKEFMGIVVEATEQQKILIESQKQNKALVEQGKQLMLDYQNEKKEHQKDKELVLHKYLTATQIKNTIWKEYGKRIIVSKVIKRIPIEDNDILYKPFTNGNYTGQQPVYHPNVLDKICEII